MDWLSCWERASFTCMAICVQQNASLLMRLGCTTKPTRLLFTLIKLGRGVFRNDNLQNATLCPQCPSLVKWKHLWCYRGQCSARSQDAKTTTLIFLYKLNSFSRVVSLRLIALNICFDMKRNFNDWEDTSISSSIKERQGARSKGTSPLERLI